MNDTAKNRRDFLGLLKPSEHGQSLDQPAQVPTGGSTVRVATRAMACDFSIIMNPGAHDQVSAVGDVLELIHDIEGWLSVYKTGSEISRVNRDASKQPVHVKRSLFELLQVSKNLFEETGGAFDVAAGAQVKLWRKCRSEQRIPTEQEIVEALESSGSQHLHLDDKTSCVSFGVDGVQLDPGAIGKGYALDSAVEWLERTEAAPDSFLLHGGHSSLVARGQHGGQSGWPVGIGNPLFTKKRLGTFLLRDQAMSTSGSNIQFYRHDGRRYGHILDPRNGLPVDGMLSVTVFADSAAVADALSTAFFVLGVENAVKCCDNLQNVGAILIPFPEKGRRVVPTIIGVSTEQIFWDSDQVAL